MTNKDKNFRLLTMYDKLYLYGIRCNECNGDFRRECRSECRSPERSEHSIYQYGWDDRFDGKN